MPIYVYKTEMGVSEKNRPILIYHKQIFQRITLPIYLYMYILGYMGSSYKNR